MVLAAVDRPDAARTIDDGRRGDACDGIGARGVLVADLVREIAGDDPTRADVESVRRAIRGLVAGGLVETFRGGVRDRRGRWQRFVCRLPTDAELARQREVEAEARAFREAFSQVLAARRG